MPFAHASSLSRCLGAPLLCALGLTLALGACSAERAVLAEITIGVEGESLCVAAGSAAGFGFVERYAVATLPDPATLTFVPGPASARSLHLTAFVTDGGAVRGRASVVLTAAEGVTRTTLAVRRCTPGAPGGFGAREGGMFAALAASPRMMTGDFDSDGIDELAAVTADGRLAVLSAGTPGAGSSRATELVTDGRLAAVGDFDGDCRLDLVAAASAGALLVYGVDGRSPAPIGPSVRAAAIGGARIPGESIVVLAGDAGLEIVSFPGAAPIVTHLASGALTYVAVGRLDAGAVADILAAGPAGAVLFLGGAPPVPVSTLPPVVAAGTGPVALADIDGDGQLDAIVAAGATLNVALGNGGGGFSSTLSATLDADIVRIEAADLDSNCTDDIVGFTTSGRPFALAFAGTALGTLGAPMTPSIDVAVIDADGDGTTEVALLGSGGGITLWRP